MLSFITDFTYIAYSQLINRITENGYTFTNYHDYKEVPKPCILCHDIDYDIEKALKLAKIEAENHSIQTTYFVLINTNFYNVFSNSINSVLKDMIKMGHEIGLHFDEMQYYPPLINQKHELSIEELIKKEISLLEQILEQPVKAISMHRPSQFTLDSNIVIPGVANRYSQTFFKDFKYVSDSRHNWREDVESIVFYQQYEKLHILTHPFWYTEQKELCSNKLLSFITNANKERYEDMCNNFKEIDEFVKLEDIL
jgi:hypothetical protein